jgi:hypothetical protein
MTYLGGSAATLIADRNLWNTRADQAWGTSRDWSIGSSFEADLGIMTTDRNTWHTRADQAWGASRVWSSGESWEAAYNRVLPRGFTQSVFTVGGQGGAGASNFVGLVLTPSSDPLGVWVGSNTVRLRAGYWSVRLSGRFNGSGTARFRILQSGANARTTQAGPDATNPGDCQETFALGGNADYTFQMAADGAVSLVAGGTVVVTFIPTETNPR